MISKTRASLYTMIFSMINSLSNIVLNLTYNYYLIKIYGSQTNGLISTLCQFVTLFSILEGGFTTASIVAIYEPIVKKDYEKLNQILSVSRNYFLHIGTIITLCVLGTGIIFLNFVDSPYPFGRTFLLLMIYALMVAFSLCFQTKYTIVLQGMNKEYILIWIGLMIRLITWCVSMFLIFHQSDILLVSGINLLQVIITTFLFAIYERINFPFIRYRGDNKKGDKSLIRGTKDVFLQKIANTIFSSTDLVLISLFINLQSASVYNLYYQVFKSIFNLLISVIQSPFNSFGQMVREEDSKNKVVYYFGIYQHIVLMLSTVILGVTGIMILPFVRVYTRRIVDFNYIYPALPLLFFSQIFAQAVNRPYGTLLNVTGNFKMQNKQCVFAAIMNIIISIAFIKTWGISSIILGSFISTLIILVMNIYQLYKKVLKISAKKIAKNIVINYMLIMICIYLSIKMNVIFDSYWELCICAFFLLVILGGIALAINFVSDRELTVDSVKHIKQMILRRN